jgi:hypothetical protein
MPTINGVGVGVGFPDNSGNLASDASSAAFYQASDYNADYDCLVNESGTTGDAYFGSSLYPDRARVYGGVGYNNGTVGNTFSTPDSAAVSVTGAIDIRVRGYASSYSGGVQVFHAKNASGAQRSWTFYTNAGNLGITLSQDGSTTTDVVSSSAIPFAGGTMSWFRVTWRPSDGRVQFFANADTGSNSTQPSSWTQLGTDLTIAYASIFDSTAVVDVTSRAGGGTQVLTGGVAYAELRNGIDGTAVSVFDVSAVPNYAYGWRSSTGEDWTTNVSTAYQQDWRHKVEPAQLGSAGFYTNAHVWGGASFHPGSVGNYWVTPHTASYTGDIDNIAYIEPASWASAGYMIVSAKRPSANILESQLFINNLSTGTLAYAWSEGGTPRSALSTVATGFTAGTGAWIRATTTQNGANRDIRFYTSREHWSTGIDSINWTQLGATVSVATTTVQANTHQMQIGFDSAGNVFNGMIRRFVMRSSIGGPVVYDFAPSVAPDLATAFTSSDSRVYTVVKTTGSDTNDPTRLVYEGSKYVYLTGVTGNYISTPDSATVSVTGDFEIMARIAANDWTPSGAGSIASRYLTAGNQRSFRFLLETTGLLNLGVSPDGIVNNAFTSTAAVPFADRQSGWVRVTRRSSDGRIQFFTASDSDAVPSSWTQLGADVTGTTGALFDGTAELGIGAWDVGGGNMFTGVVRYVQLLGSLGGAVVAKFDASLSGQTGYTDPTNSVVWTLNRASSGKKLALVDRTMLLFGTDDYLTTAHHPLLNFRLTGGLSVAGSYRTFALSGDFQDILSNGPSGTGGLWMLESRTNGADGWGFVGDGTNSAQGTISGGTVGQAKLTSFGLDRASNLFRAYMNSTQTYSASSAAVGAMTNLDAMQAGKAGSAASYTDMEFFGSAALQRALSTGELANLRTQLNGNP